MTIADKIGALLVTELLKNDRKASRLRQERKEIIDEIEKQGGKARAPGLAHVEICWRDVETVSTSLLLQAAPQRIVDQCKVVNRRRTVHITQENSEK